VGPIIVAASALLGVAMLLVARRVGAVGCGENDWTGHAHRAVAPERYKANELPTRAKRWFNAATAFGFVGVVVLVIAVVLVLTRGE
jgi:hypothetical protein